jgi:isoquinoline 1-oxidoreductase subunit beta
MERLYSVPDVRPANDAAAIDGLSRRTFITATVATGGGLLLSLTVHGQAEAERGATEFAPNAFVRIDRHGRVTLVMPQVEMGQGTYTSMPMLIAEELEVDLSQVHLEAAPPEDKLYANPLLGLQITGGSTSVRGFWEPLRRAGAVARTMLVSAAATTLNVDPASCRADPHRADPHFGEAEAVANPDFAKLIAALAFQGIIYIYGATPPRPFGVPRRLSPIGRCIP